MTYLILHKVRGEPAFDVADKLQIGDEEGWIIPTSGHRAYPVATWALDSLSVPGEIGNFGKPTMMAEAGIPLGWPDHYECEARPREKLNISSLLSGLLPKLHRRL